MGESASRLHSVARAPVRRRTYLQLLYLAVAFPLGLAYFVALVVGFSVGLSLTVVLVGLPLLVLTTLLVRLLGAVERRLANALLGTDIQAPAYRFREGSVSERLRTLVLNSRTWLESCFLLLKFPIGLGAFVFLTTSLTTSLTFLATPLYYDRATVGIFLSEPVTVSSSLSVPWGDLLVGAELATTVSTWAVDSLADALLFSAIGFVSLGLTLVVVNVIGWGLQWYTQAVLGDWTAVREAVGFGRGQTDDGGR